MVATRDLSNRRIQVWLGPRSAISQAHWEAGYCTEAELAGMLMVAPALRWDGLDFGMSESDQIDDRSLDDDAGATIRGFMQFGGGMPFFMPKVTDQTSILRQVYNLVKVQGTELAIVERIGFVDRKVPGTAGDNVSMYSAMTDGFTPDTEGDGGYAYIQSMIPRGDVAPWTIVADDPAAPVEIVGGLTQALTVGQLALRGATYLGNNIGPRATWASDDQAIATVDNRGIIEGKAAGTANITATFPGGVESDPVAVTVGA